MARAGKRYEAWASWGRGSAPIYKCAACVHETCGPQAWSHRPTVAPLQLSVLWPARATTRVAGEGVGLG
eukprot:scaffold38369_cov73-Phaeocystis_antarctica.AAC.1